jgi:protein-disulfide isomerase-like protein with CxxC motif
MGRAVSKHEAPWTPRDTLLAIEWQRIQTETCSGCGQHLIDSLDSENEGLFDTQVIICHGCAAKERKTHMLSESESSENFGKRVLVSLSQE